jgi:hypothetical protein
VGRRMGGSHLQLHDLMRQLWVIGFHELFERGG